MDLVFTNFVRRLGESVEDGLFTAVWERLRSLLAAELRRRGLWTAPPSYLGVYGWPRWDGPDRQRSDTALEELVVDCYAFIFVDRLGSLQTQLSGKPNIEGLITLNVRHFLLERQQQHDPLGFRVFEMLRAATQEAIAGGDLHLLSGDPRVRNDTLLGLSPEGGAPASEADLKPQLASWGSELLPALVTARGRAENEVVAKLRGLLAGLRRQGIAAFHFRDAVDLLKSDIRQRWSALWEEGDGSRTLVKPAPGEDPASCWVVHFQPALETRQDLDQLIERVSQAIAGAPVDTRSRQYLAALWQFFQVQSGALEGFQRGSDLAVELDDEDRFSHRKLSELLGIPRKRLPDLLSLLTRFVAQATERALPPASLRDVPEESPRRSTLPENAEGIA